MSSSPPHQGHEMDPPSGARHTLDARQHAARASLCWMLAQLLDSPVCPVDLEALRAMLELAEPPDDVRPAWRAVHAAVETCDAEDFDLQLPGSFASDLRSLARLSDRACLALVGGDHDELEHVLLERGQFLTERSPRLSIVAVELRGATSTPYPGVGRALEWVLGDARAVSSAASLAA